MKKLSILLTALLFCTQIAFADEITLPTDIQKVNIKNSYLTGVVVDNKNAKIQQVEVSKSFLVFIKVKAYPATVQEVK